jgi:hypothetical protein
MGPAYDEFTRKRPGMLVIGAGLVTSALSLAVVYVLSAGGDGIEIMGFYAEYVLPIGAFGVGLAAGSGYGVASWVTGVKISKGLLFAVVAMQIAVYFCAQYVEYLNVAPKYEDGTPVGFLRYYDFLARSFAWKQDDGSLGEPLGLWGYAFRGLELVGFVLGGLIAPAILFAKPYCQKCQVYMRTRALCLVPMGVAPRKIKKKNVEGQAAFEAEMAEAAAEGEAVLERLREYAEADQVEEFQALVRELSGNKKETAKLTRRIAVELVSCRQCGSGRLALTELTGQADKVTRTPLPPIELEPQFLRRIRPR